MPDIPIKFRHLNTFIEVARQKSVGRAAEVLHVSQPALTRSITKLEQVLQAPLLERSARGVTLTEFGRAVADHARVIEAELRNTLNDVEALRGNAAGEVAPATREPPAGGFFWLRGMIAPNDGM